MSVLGIAYPSDEEKYKLVLSAEARSSQGVVAVTKLRDKIQHELDGVKTILAAGINGVGMHLDSLDIQWDNGELKSDSTSIRENEIEFHIDRKKILDLLIGRSLYPRKDVAIREVLQNSIDACKLRKAFDKDFDPEITVYQDGDIISIEDNGIGMDFTTAEKYLSLVGSSYYSSEEFRKSSSNKQYFDPISRWGLGFLSCFLIAQEVTIETKKIDSQACKFVISSIDSKWTYEVGTRKIPGTIVTLRLGAENRSLDVVSVICNYVKRSEIPIYLISDGLKKQLQFEWNIKTEFDQRLKDKTVQEGIRQFGMAKLVKAFVWKNENFDACFFAFNKHINNVFPDQVLCCIHGMKINLPKSINISFSQVVVFLDIKKNIVDFDVAREFLLDNDKLRSLLRQVSLAFIACINKEFKTKLKGKKLFDKEITRYKFVREIAGWSELFHFLTIDDKADFLLSGVNPVITRKTITYEKLSALLDNDPERLVIFDCTSSLIGDKPKQTMSKMIALVQQSLGQDDSVLLFFGPFFYQWENTLLTVLDDYDICYEWGELENYAADSCDLVPSKIDTLLPSGCHLATIPKEFGKEAVKRIEFISNKRVYNIKDGMFNWTTASRYGPILFFDDFPEIFEELVKQGIEEQIDGEIPVSFFKKIRESTKKGEYLFNVQNESIKLLIDNFDTIQLSPESVNLAKIIIRCLLILSQDHSLQVETFTKGLLLGPHY